MKWRMTLFALLVVLALAGMVSAHIWYYDGRDQVGYEAVEVQGDEAALDGLSVEVRYAYDQRLLWATRFDAADPAGAETDFSYHLLEQPMEYSYWNESWVHVTCPLPVHGAEVSIQAGAEPDEASLLERMAWDIAQDLTPGETVTQAVRVADYCRILPVELDFYAVNRNLICTDQVEQALQDALSIPVPEDLEISLTVSLATGNTMSASTMEVTFLGYTGVVLDDAMYLTIQPVNDLGLDLSGLPLGYGVYRLPIEAGEGNIGRVLPQITNFYPLDSTAVEYVDLLESPIPGQLLVITREDGKLFLTVVDTDTGQALRRLPLPGDTAADQLTDGNALLLATQEKTGALYLTALDLRDGSYDPWMTEVWPLEQGQTVFNWSRVQVLAFDGQRLALAYDGGYAGPSFYLTVFDSTGQIYSAQYLCDAAAVSDYPSLNVETPLALTWH